MHPCSTTVAAPAVDVSITLSGAKASDITPAVQLQLAKAMGSTLFTATVPVQVAVSYVQQATGSAGKAAAAAASPSTRVGFRVLFKSIGYESSRVTAAVNSYKKTAKTSSQTAVTNVM